MLAVLKSRRLDVFPGQGNAVHGVTKIEAPLESWYIHIGIHQFSQECTLVNVFDIGDNALVHWLDERCDVGGEKDGKNVAQH